MPVCFDASCARRHVWTFLIAAVVASGRALAETPAEAELRERLRRLEENQAKLYELLKAKDARLDAVEAELRRVRQASKPGAAPGGAPSTAAKGKPIDSAPTASKKRHRGETAERSARQSLPRP